MRKVYAALGGAILWVSISLPTVWFIEWQISWFPDWLPIFRAGWLGVLAWCAAGPAALVDERATHD